MTFQRSFIISILAFVFHIALPNKYLGYFAFVGYLIFDAFAWSELNIATRLVDFGSRPSIPYSDFRIAPAIEGWLWFTLYWSLLCGLLAIVSVLLWPRGKDLNWRQRLSRGFLSSRTNITSGCIAVSLRMHRERRMSIYYNTAVLFNQLDGPKDQKRYRAEYEKTYKHEKMTLPGSLPPVMRSICFR